MEFGKNSEPLNIKRSFNNEVYSQYLEAAIKKSLK